MDREPRFLVTKLSVPSPPVRSRAPQCRLFPQGETENLRIPLLTRLLSPGCGRAERCVSI